MGRRLELLTTAEALELVGWRARSSLHRAEKSGRIRRARTVQRRPLWRREDVQRLVDTKTEPAARVDDVDEELEDDDELAALRAELGERLAAGELDGTATLRLMAAVMRRELARRVARGDAIATGELAELDRLELRLHHREQYEQLRELTRA